METSNITIALVVVKALAGSVKHTCLETCFRKHFEVREQNNKQKGFVDSVLKNLSEDMLNLNNLETNIRTRLHTKTTLMPSVYERINSPVQNDKDTLSLLKFATNLKILLSKLSHFFILQDEIIKISKWHNPFVTLMVLIFLTVSCYNPIILLLMPIFIIINHFLIPRYCFAQYNCINYVSLRENKENKTISKGIRLEENVLNSMEFIVNLTDLQNMMTFLFEKINSINSHVTNNKKLKGNRPFAIAIVGLISGLCIASLLIAHLFTGSSLFFAIVLWIIFLKRNPWFSYWKSRISKHKLTIKTPLWYIKQILEKFSTCMKNAIIFESYERVLEFQEKHSIFSVWNTVIFSKEAKLTKYNEESFLNSLSFDKSSIIFKGCKKLESILPNEGWVFEPNSEWEVEKNWLNHERNVSKHNICTVKDPVKSEINGGKNTEFLYLKNYGIRIRKLKRKICKKKKEKRIKP